MDMNIQHEQAQNGSGRMEVEEALPQNDEYDHFGARVPHLQSSIPSQPAHLTDPTMMLTDQERRWALAIKEKVNSSDSFRPLTDMECAHYAIISRGNMAEALVRIEGMQTFREAYSIDNSPEQGVYFLEQFEILFPRALMHLDICPTTNAGIWVFDFGAHYAKKGISPNSTKGPDFNWEVSVLASYYMFTVIQPSLASIREGVGCALDFADYSFEHFSFEYYQRLHDECFGYLPLKWRKCEGYNTTMAANLGFSMIKTLMNANLKSTYKMGCQLEGRGAGASAMRLREVYLQPSPETAHHRAVEKARELLILRAYHERTFRL